MQLTRSDFNEMKKEKKKGAKKDAPQQQRNNYSIFKTMITLPTEYLKYKALLKRTSIGQGTVKSGDLDVVDSFSGRREADSSLVS